MAVTDSEPNFRAGQLHWDWMSQQSTLCVPMVSVPLLSLLSPALMFLDLRMKGHLRMLWLRLSAALPILEHFRRLLHESFAMTSAELKASVERVEDAPPKRLAQPERADRLQRQKLKLTGLRIEGKLEPRSVD